MLGSILLFVALAFGLAAFSFMVSSLIFAIIYDSSDVGSISSLKDGFICVLIAIILAMVGVFIC